MPELRARVAVVTGGSRGIGAAICAALRDAGATVVAWDLDPRFGDQATSFTVDVTEERSIELALGHTLDAHGRLDIVVNNAGWAGPTMPLVDYPLDDWQRILDVNLNGVFRVCRAVVPSLVANGWGRIVNLASLAGKEGTANACAYSAAKAGVLALTKSLGKELAMSGVLVNAVAPAAVRTELLAQMSESHVAAMIAKSPMQRLGEPEEVAALVRWLASPACSFSTGAVFDLSGGRATY